MGCWNDTCMITNLPIRCGEDVKLLFLVENPDGSPCYPTLYYEPIPVLLDGKYNDYGAVEDIDHPLADFVKQTIINMSRLENVETFDDIFNHLHNEDFPVMYASKNPVQMRHVVIRTDVFNDLVEQVKIEQWQGPTYDLHGLIHAGYEWIEQIQANYELFGPTSTTVLSLLGHSDNFFGKILGHSRYEWVRTLDPVNSLITAVIEGNEEQAKLFVRAFAEMIFLQHLLVRTRKVYAVPSGAGSQDDETTYHRMVARTTIEIADKIDRYWDDEI